MNVAGKSKHECCGCNVCVEICPTQCIKLRLDPKGFGYAKVDPDRCVDCGRCADVCPMIPKSGTTFKPLSAWAAWATDHSVHRRSSSGGIARQISAATVNRGGAVYGCVSEGFSIRHDRVDSIDRLPALQNSKYAQSDCSGIFKAVADDLRQSRPVLFIGTPCQAAALRRFIPESLGAGLLIVDLICHGVPSQKMIADYLRTRIRKAEVARIGFRHGLAYCISAYAPDGSTIFESPFDFAKQRDLYLLSFLRSTTLRPSCHECHYACATRPGDLTIGDFWGLRDPELLPAERSEGISVILVNTEKGREALGSLSPDLFLIERPVSEAVAGNTALRYPSPRRADARFFGLLYPLLPFRLAVRAAWLPVKFARKIRRILKTKKTNDR